VTGFVADLRLLLRVSPAFVVVAFGLVDGAGAGWVPAVPAPIAHSGYHLVFRDDFNRLDRRVWSTHVWYDDPPSPAWDGFQTVEGGVLTLRTSRSFLLPGGAGWPINTVTSLGSGRAFRFGYFEARMRWTAAQGAWPGFWLLSTRHATNPAYPAVNPYCARHGLSNALCLSAELDIFEGQGSDPHGFYGTIHRNSCDCYGVPDAQNRDNYVRVAPLLGDRWHVYGMLWLPSRVTWYLDGRPVLRAPVYASTSQPMFLLLQMWTDGWSGPPSASTPEVLETQVDYVDVWQR
jgi:beta-glucanase (GH16 family)